MTRVAPMPTSSVPMTWFMTSSLTCISVAKQSATSSRLEVKEMRDLDIGEVARRMGVPASTLRYYEEKGLIRSVGRRGLRRLYARAVRKRLAMIGLGQSAGFSLDEIARMFAPDGKPKIPPTG